MYYSAPDIPKIWLSPCGKIGAVLISRCASTSYKAFLLSLGWKRWHIRIDEVPCDTLFTIVRDPTERFTSAVSQMIFDTELPEEEILRLVKKRYVINNVCFTSQWKFFKKFKDKAILLPMNEHLSDLTTELLIDYDIIATGIPVLNETSSRVITDTHRQIIQEYKALDFLFDYNEDQIIWDQLSEISSLKPNHTERSRRLLNSFDAVL